MSRHLFFIFFICASFIACINTTEEKVITQSIRPVKYITVSSNNTIGQHNFTGLAKAQKEANLSFRVGGTIKKILVKVGARVRKGQILATLDATDYQVSLAQSQADVQNSKAQIENALASLEGSKSSFVTAQSNYNRYEKLYETNSISLSDFEQAKSSYLGAEASYKAAITQVEAAKANNRSSQSMAQSATNQVVYTKIEAPFAGIITRIEVEPNEVVNQGSPVIEINSIDIPDVEIGIPENIISEIENNQKVSVRFNSIHDQEFKGKVHEIGYSSEGTTYPVTIRLSDSDKRIHPGMPASATFTFDDHHIIKSALMVPPSAVGEDNVGNFVYVINQSGNEYTCRKKAIKVGTLSDAGFEVLSGLNIGDLVASAGLNILRDGMQVSLYQKK